MLQLGSVALLDIENERGLHLRRVHLVGFWRQAEATGSVFFVDSASHKYLRARSSDYGIEVFN